MASVMALLGGAAFKKHAKQAKPGVVLPIDSYLTDDRSFAQPLSHGGALYLVTAGATPAELWLVAVLEAPETSGIRSGDKRKPGWFSPVNATPVTDIAALRRKLKIGKDLAKAFEQPRILTPAMDESIREMLDAVDAPVVGHVEAVVKAKALDAKLPPLERAATYLAGGHVGQAIAAMCEAWRDSRVSEVADLVDRATRLLPEYHRPLFEKRNTTDDTVYSKLWNEAFEADAATAMPQLLLNLGIPNGEVIPKRVKRLAELPLDPRVGGRLIELMSSRPSWGGRTWWPPVVDRWLKSRDARTFGSLLELDEDVGAKTTQLSKMAHTAAPTLVDADRPAVTKIEAQLHRLEEPQRMECALVDQIAAHPDDDGPYLVYADWLIEQGRPLGEFITLVCQQRQGTLTPAQVRRLTHLGEVPYLCGAFDDLLSSRLRKRERGIDREVSAYWSTQPRSWRLFAASPLVRALTSIRLVSTPRPGREEAIAEFVRAAPALQRIEDVGQDAGKKLLALLPDHGFELRLGPVPERDYNDEPFPRSADLVRGATRAGRPR